MRERKTFSPPSMVRTDTPFFSEFRPPRGLILGPNESTGSSRCWRIRRSCIRDRSGRLLGQAAGYFEQSPMHEARSAAPHENNQTIALAPLGERVAITP